MARFFSPAIWTRVAVCAITALLAAHSFGHEYRLTPFQEFMRPDYPGHPPEIRVVVSQPAGWRRSDEKEASMIAFVPNDAPAPTLYTTSLEKARLEVTCQMASNLSVTGETLKDPRNASLVLWMSTGTKIDLIKKVTVFDAGRFGDLPIWLIRGEDCSYYLVIIVRDGVLLEAGLRSENRAFTGKGKPEAASRSVLEELKRHEDALKELVRSMRIVIPK